MSTSSLRITSKRWLKPCPTTRSNASSTTQKALIGTTIGSTFTFRHCGSGLIRSLKDDARKPACYREASPYIPKAGWNPPRKVCPPRPQNFCRRIARSGSRLVPALPNSSELKVASPYKGHPGAAGPRQVRPPLAGRDFSREPHMSQGGYSEHENSSPAALL